MSTAPSRCKFTLKRLRMEVWRRNLYLIWMGQVIAVLGFSLSSPLTPFLLLDLGVSDEADLKSWVGRISLATPVGMACAAPLWGMVGDRWGRKLMLMRSQFGGGLIVGLIPFASQPWHIFALRGVQGLFTGTVVAAATLVASGTPQEHSGKALGLLATSQYIGSTLGPMLGGIVADALGIRVTFWGSSLFLISSGLVVLSRVQELEISEPQQVVPSSARSSSWQWLLFFLLLSYGFFQMGKTAVMPYLPLLVHELRGRLEQGSAVISGLLLGINGFSGALGSLLLGRWPPKGAGRSLPIGGMLLLLAGLQAVLFGLSRTLLGLSLGMAALSFVLNGFEPWFNAYFARISPAHKRGLTFGFAAQSRAVGWAVAAFSASFLTVWFSSRVVFLMALAATLLALPGWLCFCLRQRRLCVPSHSVSGG